MKWNKISKEEPKFQFLNEDIIIGNQNEAYEYLVSSSRITMKEYQLIYNLLKKNLSSVLPKNVTSSITEFSSTSSAKIAWNSPIGATKYLLSVSLNEDFDNYVTNYSNSIIVENSHIINNLSSGTKYYYKIRSVNSMGYGEYSKPFNLLTIPSFPTVLAPSNVTTTSFVAHWTSVYGASNYRLDVSTHSGFNSYLPGYQNRTVFGISQSVTGVPNNITSYYRVRSANISGVSVNSEIMSSIAIIIPSIAINAPTTTIATNIAADRFTAHWTSVYGASGYKLDVATDANFTNFVPEFEGRIVSGPSYIVSNIPAATTYYYRVRAIKNSVISNYSNVTTVTTTLRYLLIITTVTPGRAKITLNPVDVNGKQYQESWATGTLIDNGDAYELPQTFEYNPGTHVTLTAQDDGPNKFVKWQKKDDWGNWNDFSSNKSTVLINEFVNSQIRATWHYVTPNVPQWLEPEHIVNSQENTIK